MSDCGCGGGTDARDERAAIMICEGVPEERAQAIAADMYTDRCPGCGRELP